MTGINPHRAGFATWPTSTLASPGTRWRSPRTWRRCPRSCAAVVTPPSVSASGTSPGMPPCMTPRLDGPGPASAASTASTGSSRASPTSTTPTGWCGTTRRSRPTSTPTATTSPTTSPTRPSGCSRASGPTTPTSPSSSTWPTAPCTAPLHAKADGHRAPPGSLRRGLGRPAGQPFRTPARPGPVPRGHGTAGAQRRAGPRRRRLGPPAGRRAGALRPVHGGLRGHGRQRRPEPRPSPRGHRGPR